MNLAIAITILAATGCRDVKDKPDVDAQWPADSAPVVDADPSLVNCAKSFGTALSATFGRVDGTVRAIIPPDYQGCAMPNRTHLQIQVDMGGETYRMVVNVRSDQGPPDVYFKELDVVLPGLTWSDGWHPNSPFDYVAQLGLHSTDFATIGQDDLVAKISSEIVIGSKISVYATSGSTLSNSAHLVHRVGNNEDGAIVIAPDTAPHVLVMHFDEQIF